MYHLFADDIQLHLSFKPSEAFVLSMDWMTDYSLQLNADKMEVLVVAPEKVALMIMQSIGPLSSAAHSNLRNLGVIVIQSPSFDTYVKRITSRICWLLSVNATFKIALSPALHTLCIVIGWGLQTTAQRLMP